MLLPTSGLGPGTAVAQAPLYVPSEEPWVPVSDADAWEYANLMAGDFERYSSALTRHFQCLDVAWQNGIHHGRKVAAHEVFVARAKALEIEDRIGVAPLEWLE